MSVIIIRLPAALKMLAKSYQDTRFMPSMNAAVIELLETHPRIAEMAERVYAEGNPKA
jgi:hypothetical protein